MILILPLALIFFIKSSQNRSATTTLVHHSGVSCLLEMSIISGNRNCFEDDRRSNAETDEGTTDKI